MKKFREGGEYFVLSSYRLKAAPMADDSERGIDLAKTICEDACQLSAAGSGQTAIELLRVGGDRMGGRIHHVLTIRTHDGSEHDCVIRQEALVTGVLSLLRRAGYVTEELPYEGYRACLSRLEAPAVWALRKGEIQDYGVQGTYTSPPIVREVDWERIYAALDGSGCSLCVQIIPALLSDQERRWVLKSAARCSQAVDGVVPNLRDSLAGGPAERWSYFAREVSRPFAEVDILVAGPVSAAALVTARVKEALGEGSFDTVPVRQYGACGIYNQPWRLAHLLREGEAAKFGKWTGEEAARIMELPRQGDYFIGTEGNPFSLLPETHLLPEGLSRGISLGRSVFSARPISLPPEQLLLHTAVLGKSGVGKTTLLKRMIAQLHRRGIPVLILEPVKREYRDLVAGMGDSRIFTVERPVTPLRVNPFYVPRGVPLGEYRGSLLSAFKAAFSLPDPLPALFEKAISEVYLQNGWTDGSGSGDPDVTLFDMTEFIRVFKRVIAGSGYSGEVKGNMMSGGAFRLQSLLERCPYTFDTLRSTPVEDLLTGCAVLEMGSLEPEQKALVSALTLISVLAYLKATRRSGSTLRNIILLDEAHALLDQGEGATQEERALGGAMTQLMINVITEIRAYGVGVIFSDQSPSRVGGRLLDNVDNLISFRLSGEEGELLQKHMGGDEAIGRVLPAMAAGEFLLKDRFLLSPLPVRMEYDAAGGEERHVSDGQIARAQRDYLASHAKECRPFALCEGTGCEGCSAAVRGAASMYAAQIFAQRRSRLRTPEEVAAHIVRLPTVLAARVGERDPAAFRRLCGCVAVHLLRKCGMENGISLSRQAAERLLSDMGESAEKGEREHE